MEDGELAWVGEEDSEEDMVRTTFAYSSGSKSLLQ